MCGLFNSFVIDFIIRQRISLHATMSHILELPIPRYNEEDPYFSEIVQNVGSKIQDKIQNGQIESLGQNSLECLQYLLSDK